MALLKNIANSSFGKKTGGAMVALGLLTMPFAAANADGTHPRLVAAQHENVTFIHDCKYATCVKAEGSEWSENNPHSVAVSIKLGTAKLKHPQTGEVIGLRDFKTAIEKIFLKHGVNHVEFFAEQNDVPAPLFAIHVRGGTSKTFGMRHLPLQIALHAADAKSPVAINNTTTTPQPNQG